MRLFLFQRIRLTRFITLIEWASVYPKSLKKRTMANVFWHVSLRDTFC